MSQCLNPDCLVKNPENHRFCRKCRSELWLKDRYQPLSFIGQGGFGKTFLAIDHDKPSKPYCVLKQFAPNLQEVSNLNKAEQLFTQEAKRLDELGKHPQIPELFAYFNHKNKSYLVQEYIEGQNLAIFLQENGQWQEPEIRELLIEILTILQFIHRHQVIHRDIKPENIIRCNKANNYQYALVDFGAARYLNSVNTRQTGTIIGDPRYMADEQIQGKAVFASDLYSLGLTCLHLLTHMEPWQLFDSNEGKWIWRDFLTTTISSELGIILDKLVEKRIKYRFQTATDVLSALKSGRVVPTLTKRVIKVTPDPPQVLKDRVNVQRSPNIVIQKGTQVLSKPQLVPMKLGEQWGFANVKGKFVIPPKFDKASSFSEDFAIIQLKKKQGFISSTGSLIIPAQFDEVYSFSEGMAAVRINHHWGFINSFGKLLISCQFDAVDSFSQGLAPVKLNKKWGYINQHGELVISLQFHEAYRYGENGLAVVRINSKYGYINQHGKFIIPPKFDGAFWFRCGLARIRLNGKLGYINHSGKIIIPPQFQYAEDFENGKAKVRKNNLAFFSEGCIDSTGKWLSKRNNLATDIVIWLSVITSYLMLKITVNLSFFWFLLFALPLVCFLLTTSMVSLISKTLQQ